MSSLDLCTAPPAFPVHSPLHHTLQAISDLCTAAALTSTPPFAPTLCTSVRTHLLTPLRRTLHATVPSAYTAPFLSSPLIHREVARDVHALLLAILYPPPAVTPLVFAYDHLHASLLRLQPSSPSFSIVRAIWHDMLRLLKAHLFAWLAHAALHDPHHEFFITFDADDGEARVMRERLPSFVSETVAGRVLFAGSARKCTALLEVECSASGGGMLQEGLERLLEEPIHASLELEAASLRWRADAAQQLTDVLPFETIRRRVVLLRRYLLLGDARFWRRFFEEVREKPALLRDLQGKGEALGNAEMGLNQILVAAGAEVAGREWGGDEEEATEVPIRLKVGTKGTICPSFYLSLAEEQVLGSRSNVYAEVFSIAFNVRRVACELRAAFSTLQRLERQLRKGGRAGRRRMSTACLVRVRELQRRMASFVDGYEWYVQAEILHPQFAQLLDALDDHIETRRLRTPPFLQKPFFDVFSALHAAIMDKVRAQCFVGQTLINARLAAIFAGCFNLCEFVRGFRADSLRDTSITEKWETLETDFTRNVALLARLLLHMQHGMAHSRIPALLARINFNYYLPR